MASLTFDADSVQVREHIEVRDMAEGNRGFRTLSQIPHPVPERESTNAIFRYRFLRKGGAAMLIAASGVIRLTGCSRASAFRALAELRSFGLVAPTARGLAIVLNAREALRLAEPRIRSYPVRESLLAAVYG